MSYEHLTQFHEIPKEIRKEIGKKSQETMNKAKQLRNEYKPDKLDLDCDSVMRHLDETLKITSIDEQIELLEQVIDFLRMGKANELDKPS